MKRFDQSCLGLRVIKSADGAFSMPVFRGLSASVDLLQFLCIVHFFHKGGINIVQIDAETEDVTEFKENGGKELRCERYFGSLSCACPALNRAMTSSSATCGKFA